MNHLKSLLLSLLFFGVGFFVVDRAVAALGNWMFMHTNGRFDSGLRTIVKEQTAELLTMGSSRTNHHYAPKVLEDSLGMTVYNCGNDGQYDIYAHYAVLNLILQRYTPKVVVLEVHDHIFDTNNMATWKNFIGENEVVDSLFRQAKIYNLYTNVQSYTYNTAWVRLLAGMVLNNSGTSQQGYFPLDNTVDPHLKLAKRDQYEESAEGADCLRRFIGLCKQRGIRLILCDSPFYDQVPRDYHRQVAQIAAEESIPFLNYRAEGLWRDDPTKWKDASHLTGDASIEYSRRFAHDIRQFLAK